ncbi:MAG: phosphoglycerate mutase family protein [Deltaproteobacteria bacterium]|nr:phosphoglycerate mutase family protein [Deltaproteobacteria bacterium]MBM2837801.1 phosphoglycerate mutase family protein [Deltaproteobacteria bacterium]
MKYIILLGDGMSDYPISELGGKTPLQAARTPNMDYLAAHGTVGLAKTVPAGLPPGSDVANLSVFGYNPVECYTGRAPLEAASIGVALHKDDVAMRCNLVTLESGADGLYMKDFSAGHIKTEQATKIIQHLGSELGSDEFRFYPGVSYRHLLVWKGGNERVKTTPPHDITGKAISPFLPSGNGQEKIIKLMTDSQKLLANNLINPAATSIWLWGQGKAPKMQTYQEKFGLSGSVISAVDLMKGIGIYAGLDVINVPGATGWIDTNYKGKAEFALRSLAVKDFVYVHVEAPDEAAHNGMLNEKIKAIEEFDELVVGTILKNAAKLGDFKILVLPDHPTPISLKTHTSDPVPFVLYDSRHTRDSGVKSYDEDSAKGAGLFVEDGFKLMEMMTNK